MKKNTFLLLLVFFACTISNGQTLFKETDLVDEFGDKTGTILANISKGTFSNTATTGSELLVKTTKTAAPEYTLEEYKEYLRRTYEKAGFNEKQIKRTLRYAHKSLDVANNLKGTITFHLYEYNDHIVNITGNEYGQISIKLSDGTKMRAKLGLSSFQLGNVSILAYKERTNGITGLENMIKYGTYYWEQTEIYNAIINSKSPIEVVISLRNSTYRFKLDTQ
ncbi:MAG: hypothetical protein ACTHOM_08910 [Allomuricauda sp.]